LTILYLAIVALIATLSCSSSDSSSGSGSELPADVEVVIRNNLQAYVDEDVDAWYATATDDHFYHRHALAHSCPQPAWGHHVDARRRRWELPGAQEDAARISSKIEARVDCLRTGAGEWFDRSVIVARAGSWVADSRIESLNAEGILVAVGARTFTVG
jgi:hypothetical protein